MLGQAHGRAEKGARTGQVAELGHDPPLTTSPCVLAVLTTPHPAAKLKCPQTRLPIAQAVTSRLVWLPVSMLPLWVDRFQKCPRLFHLHGNTPFAMGHYNDSLAIYNYVMFEQLF